jgi:CPA2 family monovalent cation:H+ antiporter-2
MDERVRINADLAGVDHPATKWAMPDAHHFLRDLAVVLCVAAVTTIVFQRLRQPVVFGYLLAGMVIGPHIPIPLVVDEATTHMLAELGVILLMFGLGIEFSLRTLLRIGPSASLVAVAQSSIMMVLGHATGRLFGWTSLESLYIGAAIAISSTTIIVKAFAEQGAKGRFTEVVFAILIIEDLIAIFLLATLTTLSQGAEISASNMGITAARLLIFLVAMVSIGLLTVPRLVRMLVGMERPETTLIASVGVCFACALLALRFGYSVALGSFIAGMLVAESGEGHTVERLVAPVRDIFAAIFFVAVGMLIDPTVLRAHWQAVLVFTGVVIAGKVFAVTISAFLTGYGVPTAVRSGMSLAQIGEFSFIIASVGLAAGATRGFLYPVTIAVSALTTLSTPLLIRASDRTARFIDRKLPPRLQTFVALYGSWLERMHIAPQAQRERSLMLRRAGFLLLDAALIALLVIGTSLELGRVSAMIVSASGLSAEAARVAVILITAMASIPLVLGLLRTSQRIAHDFALRALPVPARGPDTGAAPRTALAVTIQLVMIIAIGLTLIAVTQPFVGASPGLLLLGVVCAGLFVVFWRRAADLHGHARAGAQVLAAALARQLAPELPAETSPAQSGNNNRPDPSEMWAREVLPGLGEPEFIRLPATSPAINRTLTSLDLRGLTGATVLAIARDGAQIAVPTGREQLRSGDVLAVAGSHEAIANARRLLEGAGTPPEPPVV